MPTFANDMHTGHKVPLVETDDILNGAVTTKKLSDDAVTDEKIANGAVTTPKIADGAVTSDKILDGEVKTQDIANGSVTTAKIEDYDPESATPTGVTTNKIADGAVTSDKIPTGAVTNDKIGDGEIKNRHINDGAVTTIKLSGGIINGVQTDAAVTKDKIADGAVTTPKIADRSITGDVVEENAVTPGKIADDAVQTRNIKDQNVTTSKIAEGNVTWSKLSSDAKNSISDLVDDAADVITNRLMRDVNTIMSDYRPIEISGNVNNAADEEDLTSVNIGGTEVIKLKDKLYAPTIYSGLGKKYMRKNMIDGVNILTQAMVSQENTIYHIQYDYDLDGEEITIPEGCTLEFDGGSLRNGSIVGNNTFLKSQVSFVEVILSGTFTNTKIETSWFGLTALQADASNNSEVLRLYLLPSCENTGLALYLSNTVTISEPMSVTAFTLDCIDYGFQYYGNTNVGPVILLNTRNINRNHVVRISNKNTAGTFDDRKDLDFIGVDCRDLWNSTITILNCTQFTIGVRISSFSGGNAYCTYNLGYIANNYRQLVIYKGTTSGWVNENIYNGGKLATTSDTVWHGKAYGICFMSVEGNSNGFNNHVFNKPCVESLYCGIYANATVTNSVMYNVRNEAVTNSIMDNDAPVPSNAESKCTVYFYRNYSRSQLYKTFKLEYSAALSYIYPIDYAAIKDRTNTNYYFDRNIAMLSEGKLVFNNTTTIAYIGDNSTYLKFNGSYKFPGCLFSIKGPSIQGRIYIYSIYNSQDANILIFFLDAAYNVVNPNVTNCVNALIKNNNNGYSYTGGHNVNSDTYSNTFAFKDIPTEEVAYVFIGATGSLIRANITVNSANMTYVPFAKRIIEAPSIGRSYLCGDSFHFINTTLQKEVLCKYENSEYKQYDMNGYPALISSGTTNTRPAIELNMQGYQYYDTTLCKTLSANISQETRIKTSVAYNSTKVVSNTLTTGALHNSAASKLSIKHKVYFATINSADDPNAVLVVDGSTNTFYFTALDSSEYPYLILKNEYGSGQTITISEVIKSWKEQDGTTAGVARSGDTASRPVGSDIYVGFQYMDTSIGAPIWASAINGDTVTWVKADGTDPDSTSNIEEPNE